MARASATKQIKLSSSSPLLLLFLCHFLALLPLHSSQNISESDRQALLCLKSSLAGTDDGSAARAALATWRDHSPQSFCQWHGVSCTTQAPIRVVALELSSLNLTGRIPPCVGNLTSLTRINLAGNLIGGVIPPEIGRLTELRDLDLSNNALVGTIPLSSCSRLETLILWRNQLEGEIPKSLSQCLSLRELKLSQNNLHGQIPAELSLLPNLSVLYLASNQLSGTIPLLLGSTPNLTALSLRNNMLTGGIPGFLVNSSTLGFLNLASNSLGGNIPPGFFNSSVLYSIDLSYNHFVGPIPEISNSSLPLKYIYLTSNNLLGSIPSSFGHLRSLSTLFLALNNLEGTIPESLGNNSVLQELDLSYNMLSGTVPPAIYIASSLTYLGLGSTRLSGRLPNDIGYTLPSIQTLVMQGSQFDGHIPASLANATNLQELDLRNNSFSGVIPSLGSLRNLHTLDLGNNRLEAGDWAFMSSLASCTQLQKLYLDKNNLQGSLPTSIANLPKSLELLLLNDNQIVGSVPHGIENLTGLTILHLERNFLTGHIPTTLGNLQNLFVLNLAGNNFSGEIPSSIGNLQKLSELYLQNNVLSGSIPTSLANCKKLVTVNISCNSINGSIPQQFFSISSLSEGLDFSYNKLAGPIPEFTSLINIELLNLSNNHLSGRIPSSIGQCSHLEYIRLDSNYLQGSIPGSLMNLRGMVEMDLSQNNLSGEIPNFLGSFSSLRLLNLSFNNFQGPVPSSGIFGNSGLVFVQGNKNLCSNSPALQLKPCVASASKRKRIFYAAVMVPLVILVLVALSSAMAIIYKRRKATTQQPTRQSSQLIQKFSYHDLFKATSGFSSSNRLGDGRFGSVYRGLFTSEPHITAIKVFKLDEDGASKSFMAECEALRNTRHRNLVRVISVCSTFDPTGNEFKALVLEHMPNGNLESWLHPEEKKHSRKGELNLGSKVSIAADIAAALDYLHNQCKPPLVHCDLKPSNILLDNDMVAHVGDFGLAKFLYNSCSSTSLVGARGSIGYIAPEYGMGSKMSIEGDIYSYGVILLEMLTGKNPTDQMFAGDLTLRRFVELAFPEKIDDISEHNFSQWNQREGRSSSSHNENGRKVGMHTCVMQLITLGLRCCSESPKDRPLMDEIYTEVASIKEAMLTLCI